MAPVHIQTHTYRHTDRVPTCVHGEEPGDGVQLRDEANVVEVVEQAGVVEGYHVGELGKVFLDDGTVVPQKEFVQVLLNEPRQAGVGKC